MNELINQVTPLTRGIIWLSSNASNPENPHYAGIDYLLDGLLTANLKNVTEASSRVIIGQNFNAPLYVMIINEVRPKEVQSFLSLFETTLTAENIVLVIDEMNLLPSLKAELKSISANLKQF